jgi:dextranase
VAFADLNPAYVLGEPILVGDLPPRTTAVLTRTASDATFEAELLDGSARLSGLPVGTHAIEARSSDGAILAEEFTSVRERPGDDPIMGFATSFCAEHVPSVLAWLRSLRCTVVQIYDWMERYSTPLPEGPEYRDPLGRPLQRVALEQLIHQIRELGAVAQAYAPVYAADDDFAEAHPEWRLFQNDRKPETLGELLQIMDPSNPSWQSHWLDAYGAAADTLGFNGFHLDSYGYPRCAFNAGGQPVSVERGYSDFVHAVRTRRPRDVISFNQVNGVPRGFQPPDRPGFRYVEVWHPNDKWRHLEGLLQRSSGGGPRQGDTLAIYPPVWAGERSSALRTAVLTEAIATTLGAGVLLWGDDHGLLRHPYYVDHERLQENESNQVLDWHRFGLRIRDLFLRGLDTSWYELGDENGAVSVSWDGIVSPEPIGNAVFARVVRGDNVIAVSLLDLTGSDDGAWTSPTQPGDCTEAEVSVLVVSPERWSAQAAVLGRDHGRFAPLNTVESAHREGRAISCRVPIVAGWSVLRLEVDRRPNAGAAT